MNEREIFAAALEQPTAAKRQAFLDEVCDDEMRRRIERLLKEQSQLGSFLEHPLLEADADALQGIAPTIVYGDGSTNDNEDDVEHTEQLEMSENPREQDDEISLGFLAPSSQPDSLGRLGHYEILEVVGRGAFGIVLRAFDEKLQRVVAVKVLSPEMAATSPARKRFLREARTSAQIRHENVVAIYAVEDDPIPHLVMEYIPGKTLQERLDEHGPLDLPDVLRLGKQIADGLAAAHEQGLIHRDIKPGNILLEGDMDERVKITDFGLARTADDASLTQSGVIAGTPMYMAPEQALGHKVDQRADLFSLGSVLYQMLSGRPPFRERTTMAVLKRVTEDTPRPIQEIIPETPDWMCKLIGHLHDKDPENRYGSAREVSELLAECAKEREAGRVPLIPDPSNTADQGVEDSPVAVKASRDESIVQKPLVKVAAAVLFLLGLLGITEATGVTKLASTVIRLATGSGTLVIETDDPGVKIAIEGEEVTITGGGVEELTLRPGDYTIAALKDGEPVKQVLVTITRNRRTIVRMSLEPSDTTTRSSVVKPAQITQPTLFPWPADAPPPAIAPFDTEQAQAHQEAWAKYLGVPVEYENSIGMKFCLIPPGEFLMGSTADEQAYALEKARAIDDQPAIKRITGERPIHRVQITQPFYLGKYEVTHAQWQAVMGEDAKGDPTRPVDHISWDDIQRFLQNLNEHAELETTEFGLPTEAQWEYACRAGSTTYWHCGDAEAALSEYGWFKPNAGGKRSVGRLKPNAWNLYDMHGNLWEWCADRYMPTYYEQSPIRDPKGSTSYPLRVVRGGAWYLPAEYSRSAHRFGIAPTRQSATIGFRPSMAIGSTAKPKP